MGAQPSSNADNAWTRPTPTGTCPLARRREGHMPFLMCPLLEAFATPEDIEVYEFPAAVESSPIDEDSEIYRMYITADASLGTATLRECVKLPKGVDRNAWIASQMLGIFEEVRLLVCLLRKICTKKECPHMSVGAGIKYVIAAGEGREMEDLCAISYMMRMLEWSHAVLKNRQIVPLDGRPFPANFFEKMQEMARKIFRIYAHTYVCHFVELRGYGAEAHLNCIFKHFLFLIWEFNLLDNQDMAPILDLVEKFKQKSDEEDEAMKKAAAEMRGLCRFASEEELPRGRGGSSRGTGSSGSGSAALAPAGSTGSGSLTPSRRYL